MTIQKAANTEELTRADESLGQLPFGAIIRDGKDQKPALFGGSCGECGTTAFPMTAVCPACMCEAITPVQLPREGVLYSFTVLRVGAGSMEQPAAFGYVDLANGLRIFAPLRGVDFTIDQRVELEIPESATGSDGVSIQAYCFKPTSNN